MASPIRFPYLTLLALITAFAAPVDISAQVGPPRDRYIVVLNTGGGMPEDVAADVALRTNGRVGYIYGNALRGFSITMPRAALASISRDPRVAYVEEDRPVSIVVQTIPTGLDRIDQPGTGGTSGAYIDGNDDYRVDVDVAVLDTGIDRQHADLNVIAGTNCMKTTGGGPPWARNYYCDDSEDGDDDHYHGTHVAGTIAAIDNSIGVVGVAPGARLHAVKVLDSSGSGYTSGIIAGIDWVVQQGNIEIINMSLGGSGVSQSYADAIDNAVANGVVVVVAAGNNDADASNYSPAFVPSAITVSALADFDGVAGGLGSITCRSDQDDTLADFSNWGSVIDIAAPGVCILSTFPIEKGSYGTISGTSMAAPHVAGAAALLASGANSPMDESDVNALRDTLVNSGNFGWTDDSDDGPQEPLLDISTFAATYIASGESGGGSNASPTVSFTHGNCVAGQACSFDGSASDDTDGTITAYEWDFDDDGVTDATGAVVDYAFASSGTHSVMLRVTDNDGASASETQSVDVSPQSSGAPNPCTGLGNGIHLNPSSTNQGGTWTAIVDAVNCDGGNVANFGAAQLTWSPDVGTSDHDCSIYTGVCVATQSGIRKRIGSVVLTLDGTPVTISKP